MDNQDVMAFDAQPVQQDTPAQHLNPGAKTFKSKPVVSGMTFDQNPVSEDTHANDLPDPTSQIFHDAKGKNYRVPKNQLQWASDNGYQPGPYEDTQAYKYSQYGLDIKGKISNSQLSKVQQYDIDKGNFTPDTSTAGDMVDNSYTPSDEALKSVGVDPQAYRNNKSTTVIRSVSGKAVPQMDEEGNITGDSGGNPMHGIRTGITNVLSLPGSVYHAFADDARTEEEAGRNAVSLGLHRLLVDPNVADLQKSAQAFREGHISEGLGYGAAGLVPVAGPLISHTGEAIGQDPIEGTFEGATYLLAPKVLKEGKTAAGSLASKGASAAADLAGKVTPPVLGAIAKTAGKVTGGLVKVGVKAGTKAAPYVGDYLSGVAESLTGAIGDKIPDLTEGTASDAMNALKNVKETAIQKLAEKGITGEAALQAANDLVGRVQEQARTWGSGASDAVDSLKTSMSGWADRVKAAVPEAAGKLGNVADTVADTVKSQVERLTDGTASDALDAMARIRASALQDLANRGVTGDAARAAVNNLMETVHDSYKAWTTPVGGGAPIEGVKGTVSDWVKGLNDRLQVPEDATPIAKAANTPAGAPLKAVATPGQLAGGLLATLERMARKTGEGIGDKIAAKYDAPARVAAEQSLNNAIDGLSPETANMTQQERIDFLSKQLPSPPSAHAQALIDFNRRLNQRYAPTGVVATEATKPPALRANEADTALRNRLSGAPGEMDPGLAFSRMRDMSTEEFLQTLAKAKADAPAVRQGYFRYLADSTKDPETGAYRFGKMNDLVRENYGKLGSDAAQFKTLSEGLAELQKSFDMTNTKSRTLLWTVMGTFGAGVLEAILSPDPLSTLVGAAKFAAGEALVLKYAVPFGVDLLMKPRNLADLNILARAASRVPSNAIDEKQIRQAASRINKSFTQPLIKSVTESLKKHKPLEPEAETPKP
jgi:hypothetical protein